MPIAESDLEQTFEMARMELVGVSDRGLRLQLFEVLKEFSEDSNAWWEDIQINPIVGTQDYPLAPLDAPSQIIRFWGAWDSNYGIIAASMPHIGTLRLRHAPTTLSATPWHARVVLTVAFPTRKGEIPNFSSKLFRQYSVTILDGILGKMMSQENMSYKNEKGAIYHLRRFRTGIQTAKAAANRHNIMGGQNWSYPRGWNSRGQRGGVPSFGQR